MLASLIPGLRRAESGAHRSLFVYKNRWRHLAWLGTIRRTTPLSDHWGFDRGTPVDRYYIEKFLEAHRRDIHGRVLEVMDSRYTERYGNNIDRSDVLDIDPTNPRATIIADLTAADSIADNQFDCFILPQTLQFIYDTLSAIRHAYRILKPGGVLLATVPSVSKMDGPTDCWRFTPTACTTLFGQVFGPEQINVQAHGNVLTATAFLMGMAWEELRPRELAVNDPRFPLIVTIRAVKCTSPTTIDDKGENA